MIIGDYAVANPTRVEKSISALHAVNETLTGIVVEDPLAPNSYIVTLRVQWDAVAPTELSDLRIALAYLVTHYAYVQIPYLGGAAEGNADALMATLSPNSAPKIQMNQETAPGSVAAYAFQVEAELISSPGQFTV